MHPQPIGRVFRLSDAEFDYYHNVLPEENQSNFLLFLKGFRISRDRDVREALHVWENATDETIRPFTLCGLLHPNVALGPPIASGSESGSKSDESESESEPELGNEELLLIDIHPEVFELNVIERAYFDRIRDPFDEEDFLFFIMGNKYINSEYVGVESDVLIHSYNIGLEPAYIRNREEYIQIGMLQWCLHSYKPKDPIEADAHKEIFGIRKLEQEVLNGLEEDTRFQERFRNFLTGVKYRCPSYRDGWNESRLVDLWEDWLLKPDQMAPFVAKGRELRTRYVHTDQSDSSSGQPGAGEEAPSLDEGAASQYSGPSSGEEADAHKYRRSPNPPTKNDRLHINKQYPPPLGSEWKFVKTLFSNPHYDDLQRVVHLFVRSDENGNIERQLVIKIVGEQEVRFVERDLEMEYGVHSSVSEKGCPYILDMYACSQRPRTAPPHLGYLYMEYAPFGNLYNLIRAYNDPKKNSNNVPQIPEIFLWILFRGMAEALHLLETGKTVESDETPPEKTRWIPIYHLDIKPHNIVLGSPSRHIGFQTPKLIDFGSSFKRFQSIARWRKENGIGTPGHRPPEQHENQDPAENPCTKKSINSLSDVWAVGLVIRLLTSRKTMVMKPENWAPQRIGSIFQYLGLPQFPRYDGMYSKLLEDLIQDCLRADPDARPDVGQLLRMTNEGLERYANVYGEKVLEWEREELPRVMRLLVDEDEFAKGRTGPGAKGKKRMAEEDAEVPRPSKKRSQHRAPTGEPRVESAPKEAEPKPAPKPAPKGKGKKPKAPAVALPPRRSARLKAKALAAGAPRR